MGEPAVSVQPVLPVKAGAWIYMEQIELQAFIDESRKFQTALALDMVTLKGELKTIAARLDKINGSVGRHDEQIRLIQDQRLAEASVAQAMSAAKEVFRKKYQPYIDRSISAVAGAILIYILTHGPELAKMIGGK